MKLTALFFIILLFFLIPQPASAYLDPGFGSMVWQLVLTMLFGATFALKLYWQKIKNFFKRTSTETSRE